MSSMPVIPRPPPDNFFGTQRSSRLPSLPLETTNFSCFPQCFVKLPTNVWWPCFYLPQHALIAQVQEALYRDRLRKEPENQALKQEMKKIQVQFSLDLYKNCRNVDRPVWLLMGRTSQVYPFDQVTTYITFQDDEYLVKCQELFTESNTNSSLKQALQEFVEYRTLSQSQRPNITMVPLPHRELSIQTSTSVMSGTLRDTTPLVDQCDTATIVTTVSEGPALETTNRPSSSKSKKRPSTRSASSDKQGPKRSRTTKKTLATTTPKRQHPTSSDAEGEPVADHDSTPVTAHKRPTEPPSTASKFNHQALVEAQRGPNNVSPRTTRGLSRREVFPVNTTTTTTTDDIRVTPDALELRSNETEEVKLVEEKNPTPEAPSQDDQALEVADAINPVVPFDAQATTVSTTREEEEEPEIEPDPLTPVHLPGRTVGEKLQSCLDVLRKENESVVGCRKVVSCKHRILEFFNAVIGTRAKRAHQPNYPPIMYVCGAPGSGKTMTVEDCGRLATTQFSLGCDEYEAPPRVVYLNCSHLRHLSTDAALHRTLAHAKMTERDMKKTPLDDETKPVVIFVLDEIDYLVSTGCNNDNLTKTEKYLKKLIEWAESESYLVGLVGISNSVENDKAQRLEKLGFPRANKVVFKTYESEDLTYIALSRIGSTVVDAKAIEFLSKSVAIGSGDARKHLEFLSRTISYVRESMTDEMLNTEHQGPVIKVPHVKKMINQSIMKSKDLLEASPTLDKHVLCFCMQLATRMGSHPMTLKTLLWALRECYRVVEIEGTSHLRGILERLVDDGLLKLMDNKMASDEIRFEEQLDEVESAVREVLMTQQFYKDMAAKLQSIPNAAFL